MKRRHATRTFLALVLFTAACSDSPDSEAALPSAPRAAAAPSVPTTASPTATSPTTTAPATTPPATAPPATAPRATGPPPTTDPAGSGRVCLPDAPDETRCWLELDASAGQPAPLLIDLHGYGQPAADLRKYSGMEGIATRERLVVVWPDSPDRSWNAGDCCGRAHVEDRDDVGFISELIGHVSERLPVDTGRVYLTGFSNGCAMAQRVAAELSDRIAAVACYSDYLSSEPAADYDPVPVLEAHGEHDAAVPYSGVTGGAIENAEAWARHNGCASEPQVSATERLATHRYGGCRNGADVVHVAIVDGGHVPTPEIEIHELLWQFLEQH